MKIKLLSHLQIKLNKWVVNLIKKTIKNIDLSEEHNESDASFEVLIKKKTSKSLKKVEKDIALKKWKIYF